MAIFGSSSARGALVLQPIAGVRGGDLVYDLAAGLTLAAIAVPEQMATARLGGFTPQVGFLAFAAAAVGFAVFGTSRRLSAGGDSTITPIFAASLALLAAAGSPQYAALAAALALMVGAMVMAAGYLKLGWVANFLSKPVTTGFLAGVAVHIAVSQAPGVLGLPEESGDVFHRIIAMSAAVAHASLLSVVLGLGVLGAMVAAEAISARIPGALLALAAATAATALLGLDRHGVATLGAVPLGALRIALPSLRLDALPSLGGLAFIITLVILMQTAATARAFPDGEADPNVDQDYIGLGAGSILAGLVGAYPVNASPPRTAIVASAGGRSGLSSLIAAAVVMGLAAFGGGLLGHVPAAALGGVLLFIASKIFRVGEFADVLKRSPAEFGLAALTTGLIIVLPIQSGVAVGVFVSLIHGVFTITRARPILFERVAGTTVWWPATPSGRGVAAEALESVVVVGFQAPLSFLNAYDFHRGVLAEMAAAKARARLIVLEASSIVEIDFTAAGLLCDVIARAHAQGMDFAVARLESLRAADAFKRFGVLDRLGADRLFTTVDEAVRTLAPQAQP